MDSSTRETTSTEAVEFVRFCYRRRRVGWPELYDEMCAVASRGLFRGWGTEELAAQGIGFSLFELSGLSALVSRVQAEEQQRRLVERAANREAAQREALAAAAEAQVTSRHHEALATPRHHEGPVDEAPDTAPRLRFAGAGAGA